ncbi:MAG: hypothetical protein COB59_03795 [Rhodospirillaceae bacterium]|nr:MAG: hypothetical protein COB59_03795 [Rhodospirillaceae bacterium]
MAFLGSYLLDKVTPSKCLIIDDDIHVRTIISAKLSKAGNDDIFLAENLAAGATGYFAKSISLKELRKRLRLTMDTT